MFCDEYRFPAEKKRVDLLVTVTTEATQLALAVTKHTKNFGLAANPEPSVVSSKSAKKCLLLVRDEIETEKTIQFLSEILKKKNMITIIHSSQERYIREAKTFEARLTTLGFKVKRSMIAVASDIPATVRLNRKTNQVFFILKDNLLASSIQILLKVAPRAIFDCSCIRQ